MAFRRGIQTFLQLFDSTTPHYTRAAPTSGPRARCQSSADGIAGVPRTQCRNVCPKPNAKSGGTVRTVDARGFVDSEAVVVLDCFVHVSDNKGFKLWV